LSSAPDLYPLLLPVPDEVVEAVDREKAQHPDDE
jgi:hypothetical protein